MAIFKSTIQVNNGNTGWTRQHVMDALETAFSQLGYNGGTLTAGVPVATVAPGQSVTNASPNNGWSSIDYNWHYAGGAAPAAVDKITRHFHVTANGTSSYSVLEQWFASSVSTTNDTLTIERTILATGDAVVWNPSSVTGSITPLVNNTTYYVIKTSADTIKLAATLDDATNGIAINITASSNSSNVPLRRAFSVLYNNYQIDASMADTLNFNVDDSTSGGGFYFIDKIENGYNSTRILNANNFPSQSYKSFPTGMGGNNPIWNTRGWPQTENESLSVHDIPGYGYSAVVSYGYANSANPSMKGVIKILPVPTNEYTENYPYWKYTVPAYGSKSSFKLRVYRNPQGVNNPRSIAGVSICSIGSGWADNDVFTIPGSAIGGLDVVNDITFGINSLTSAQQSAKNAVPSILVTNFGAGSTMYQKHPSGYFGVVKLVNDNTKTFGTTYYGIGLDANNYTMYFNSGPMWQSVNTLATKYPASGGQRLYGYHGGDRGLDYQQSNNFILNQLGSGIAGNLNYASTSTPTAYPLAIKIYRAQSPQDTNFAIIQFVQTINNEVIPFATFSLNKGPNYGANIYDLNHVWQGGMNIYGTSYRSILMYYLTPGLYQLSHEPPTSNTLAREANYGYLRNSSVYGNYSAFTNYECNIDTTNDLNQSSGYNQTAQVSVTYYRNSTYDYYYNDFATMNFNDQIKNVSSSANYYKPMKGIPISQPLMPCPYYLPDDFVLLQVSTSPGLTEFRPGDTVTISPSEIYEIVLAGFQTQQNGLDQISNNSSMGMLLMARTT